MAEKAQVTMAQQHFDKEELGEQGYNASEQLDNKIGEVGVIDAPDGGRAAWTVIFGCFCVSSSLLVS
jgi:hypothetical protein